MGGGTSPIQQKKVPPAHVQQVYLQAKLSGMKRSPKLMEICTHLMKVRQWSDSPA